MAAEKRAGLVADLVAEGDQVDGMVEDLSPGRWDLVTTREGWTIKDQVTHLLSTDLAMLDALREPALHQELLRIAGTGDVSFVDLLMRPYRGVHAGELRERWRAGRADVAHGLLNVPAGEKVDWFGPPSSPETLATVRLMETWAHGHDIADALGVVVPRTGRIRHVCHLAVRTMGAVMAQHWPSEPIAPVRVELTAPDGQVLSWGPEEAADRVTGDAYGFAVLACRRRHRDDVDVAAAGAFAGRWLDVVQAFAGPPGRDPEIRRGHT